MSEISGMLDRAKDALGGTKALLQSVITGAGSEMGHSEAVAIDHSVLGIDPNYTWDGGDGLLAFKATGAGTSQLSENMEGLSDLLNENPDLLKLEPPNQITPEIAGYIEGIAEARGIPLEDAEASYARFVELVNAGDIDISTTSKLDVHGFGNEAQLRFGYITGEALGLDPAFASLMNPSGGLTGPGEISANIDGDGLIEELVSLNTGVGNEALSYHGPTHDALGFLNNKFGTGPGYCYADGVDCLPVVGTNSPYSGQLSGIEYWEDKLDLSPGDALTEARHEVGMEGVEADREISREWTEAGGELDRETSEAGEEISREFDEAGREISEATSTPGKAVEVVEGGTEVLLETGEAGAELIWETTEGAVETGLEIGEGKLEELRESTEGVLDVAGEIQDGLEGDGVPYIPGI